MNITTDKKQALKKRAHNLKPVVMIGSNGLTANVMNEIDLSLEAHELIKIRIADQNRDTRQAITTEICEQLDAAPIQTIGRVIVIYRPRSHHPAA